MKQGLQLKTREPQTPGYLTRLCCLSGCIQSLATLQEGLQAHKHMDDVSAVLCGPAPAFPQAGWCETVQMAAVVVKNLDLLTVGVHSRGRVPFKQG